MTLKNKKLTSRPYKITIILTISISSIFMIGMSEKVFAAACPNAGANGESRCYATDTYSVFPTQPVIQGLSGYNTVYNTAVVTGAVVDSNWVIFSDFTFVEVAWIDQKDTLSGPVSPKYTCGKNGAPVTPFGNPTPGTFTKFEISDVDNDNKWIAKIGSTSYPTQCTFTMIPDSRTVKTGYEIWLVDTTPVTNNDHNLYQVHSGTWKYWQGSPVGGHGSTTAPGFFVKYCGTGAEQYYHHIHGKGTAPASC